MKSLNKITKLSELLEVAVNDYKKITKDNRYCFEPNLWHTKYKDIHKSSNNRCNVCLAGCVIAKTLDIPSHKETDPKSLILEQRIIYMQLIVFYIVIFIL